MLDWESCLGGTGGGIFRGGMGGSESLPVFIRGGRGGGD